MYRARAWMRRLLAFALYYSGALWLYARLKLRGRVVALMYHRVLPPGTDSFSADAIVVSTRTFERQVEFLRRHFRLLDVDDLRHCLAQERFPDRGCVITFDDGWYDNEHHALPILQRHEAPALFFVATAYIGTTETFWQEQMARLLFHALQLPDAPSELLAQLQLGPARAAGDDQARRMVRDAVTRMKSAQLSDIEALKADLLQLTGLHAAAIGDDRFMDWDAVRRIATSAGTYAGSHAHCHVPLTRLGSQGALEDLLQARAAFHQEGLSPPTVAAYPNGEHDDSVVEAARNAGIELAFTTSGGLISPGQDPLRLPRINISETATATMPEFMCRILGVF